MRVFAESCLCFWGYTRVSHLCYSEFFDEHLTNSLILYLIINNSMIDDSTKTNKTITN